METHGKHLRFKNLGPKIKHVREKVLKRVLGKKVTQEEFAKFFPMDDDNSGKTLQRSTVARWEAEDEHIRTAPQVKYLRMLANKTDDPAHYYYWFLDDFVSVDDYVLYSPDGTRLDLKTKSELRQREREEEEYYESYFDNAKDEPDVYAPEGLGAQAFKDDSAVTALVEKFKVSYLQHTKKRGEVGGLGALEAIQKQQEQKLAEQEEIKFNRQLTDFWPAICHKLRKKNIDLIEGALNRPYRIGTHLSVITEYRDTYSAIVLASIPKSASAKAISTKIVERIGRLTAIEMAAGPLNKLLIIVTQDKYPYKNLTLMEIAARLNECHLMRAVVTNPDAEDHVAKFVHDFLDGGNNEVRRNQLPLAIPLPE